MRKYFKDSIDKFKKDALSKIIYDILKWILGCYLAFLATKLLPEGSVIVEALSVKFEITIYWLVISGLSLIVLTILAVRFIFKKQYNALKNDNYTDELTGLKNHKALKVFLDEKLRECKGNTLPLALIIIDIDDFKKFNSEFGYNVADRILSKVGELLASDKRATDETFRYFNRGDEFLVVATDTNQNGAFMAAERKRKLIQNSLFDIDGKHYKLTVCCGVTEYKKNSDDYTSINNRVINALNEAKKNTGKNMTKSII